MATDREDKKKSYQTSCFWLMVLVVVLLLLLGYFAIYRDKPLRGASSMRGGKWTARGGCACLPPK